MIAFWLNASPRKVIADYPVVDNIIHRLKLNFTVEHPVI